MRIIAKCNALITCWYKTSEIRPIVLVKLIYKCRCLVGWPSKMFSMSHLSYNRGSKNIKYHWFRRSLSTFQVATSWEGFLGHYLPSPDEPPQSSKTLTIGSSRMSFRYFRVSPSPIWQYTKYCTPGHATLPSILPRVVSGRRRMYLWRIMLHLLSREINQRSGRASLASATSYQLPVPAFSSQPSIHIPATQHPNIPTSASTAAPNVALKLTMINSEKAPGELETSRRVGKLGIHEVTDTPLPGWQVVKVFPHPGERTLTEVKHFD